MHQKARSLHMPLRYLLVCIISLASLSVSGEVLIGKDQYLFVPKSDNRRLLLEPGAVLLRKSTPTEAVYKKRIRVISLGGVEGEVRSRGVNSVNDMSGMLAYVKKEVDIKGSKYPIGTVFPVETVDDEDELLYRVTYPRPTYSVKNSGFVTKEKMMEYTEVEFSQFFNLIDPASVSGYKFPFWKNDSRYPATEWGCGESKEVTKTLDASAGAEVEAGGGFFSYFQAKAEASAGASTSTTYKKLLKDDSYRHRITYWVLSSTDDDSNHLLNVALEKISVCDTSKGVNNSYIIRFDKKYNYDEITINPVWVEGKGFKKGGGSPMRIDNQADLNKFENAFKDFKFKHTLGAYDIKRAILDFTVWLTVNLNYARHN